MKKTWLLLIPAVLTLGCGGEGRYQIVSAEQGSAYRLDTKTGEVLAIFGDKSLPVMPANPPEAKK